MPIPLMGAAVIWGPRVLSAGRWAWSALASGGLRAGAEAGAKAAANVASKVAKPVLVGGGAALGASAWTASTVMSLAITIGIAVAAAAVVGLAAMAIYRAFSPAKEEPENPIYRTSPEPEVALAPMRAPAPVMAPVYVIPQAQQAPATWVARVGGTAPKSNSFVQEEQARRDAALMQEPLKR